MDQKNVVSQRIGNLLCRDNVSVTELLGIQSQVLRYSKWAAKVRGIDVDAEPDRYFRAWTLRGTIHIHEMRDYGLYLHEGSRSPYMKAYWDDASAVSHAVKRRAEDRMLRLIGDGVTRKKDIVAAFRESGASKDTVEYLFHPWGGLPRILMERGEILQTVSDELSYASAPKVPVMTAEQAEPEQMKRYLEAYAPCSIRDAVYFFRYSRTKAKRLMEECVAASSGRLIWNDGVVRREPDTVLDAEATDAVFVLPGFDPLLMGYEKKENAMIPAEHLRDVYTLQGIIKPVILHRGRCVAVWTVRKNTVYIRPFQAENKAACEQAEERLRALTRCDACRYEQQG